MTLSFPYVAVVSNFGMGLGWGFFKGAIKE
jgi:hypothetical protein